MGRSFTVLLAFVLYMIASSAAQMGSTTVKHYFHVKNLKVNHLCKEQVVVAVNGTVPGPTIEVREGDTLFVEVFNDSPYDLTIHWHGIFQKLSAWADGPQYVTQCPIRPGHSYIYKFKISGQEGTLWWHAHSSSLRATVYGALIIRPRFPIFPLLFPKPVAEIPILLGEWWNANIVDVENEAIAKGGAANNSDAYTINGKPGDLYACSKNDMYKLEVVRGETYLLRIINAALNNQLFFKIAGHTMTVVAVDAVYTDQYKTDVVVVAPGQTTDVLLFANRPAGTSYYMAARAYSSAVGLSFDNTTARALLSYAPALGSKSTPKGGSRMMPTLPHFHDTKTAHRFSTSLTSRIGAPHWTPVPQVVHKRMFIAFGLGLEFCAPPHCTGIFGQIRLSASMNNHSFVIPSRAKSSMIDAFFSKKIAGVYTNDFPDNPPMPFNYTDARLSFEPALLFAGKGTRVKRLEYNDVVEVVLQNTALIAAESHPIHLHGFNFHVLAQGFGNFDRARDSWKFNILNPQSRNTIAVPVGGWSVIRFQADNPGVWLMHCHLDVHVPLGMAMAFEVPNGPTKSTTLPPPPSDFPKC